MVREYCGHGVGLNSTVNRKYYTIMRMDGGVILKPGMVFTIEPMINAGKKKCVLWAMVGQ